jgi:FtsP/CotA-like multicopper oxidase with cupredoxin domain
MMRRRDFLAGMGAGAAVALGRPKVLDRFHSWPAGGSSLAAQSSVSVDVELELRAAPGTAAIVQGTATRVWSYSGRVLKGPPTVVQAIAGSYLGPTLRFQTGQRVRIHFRNELPEETIIHWHGLDVPAQMDGHPHLAIASGNTYVYEFTVVNRPGTYWYHPHPHERVGPQVNRGLAGVILVSDAEESALKLPAGTEEIVCVIQDRLLDAGNQFVYVSGMPMDRMSGFLGDRILVNGRPSARMSLATRAYRFRLMNGSNSRVYKLAWSDDTPMTVLGTDGGLLERPVMRNYVTLAPAERIDLVLDLSQRQVGSRLVLRSLAFPSRVFEMRMGMGMGMGRGRGRGMTASSSLPNGAPFDILAIDVGRRERSTFVLPSRLSTYDAAWQLPASVRTRVVRLDFQMMQFVLNGRRFDLGEVTSDETVQAGSTHVWEFDNSGPAMMNMRLGHPMHVHGRQFRVLSRHVEPARLDDWQTLNEGFVDEGWKDTVLVMPGEKVRILLQFSKYPGLYLYHCHNLEHEDAGMMRNFRIL